MKDELEPSADAPRPWWATVTTQELASSRGLVEALLTIPRDGSVPAERLARALAIQHLCISDSTLPDALAKASERTSGFGAKGFADEDVVGQWLDWCGPLNDIFVMTFAMIGQPVEGASGALFRQFVMSVEILRSTFMLHVFSKGGGAKPSAGGPAKFRDRGRAL